MADPIIRNLVKQFLTKNFKPLFTDNELGALGNLGNTSDDLIKKFGSLPSYEVTGDEIREALSGKFRAMDSYKQNATPFQSAYTGLVQDPLKDFNMTAQVGALGKDPTLVKDASILQGKTIVPIVGDRTSRDVIVTGIGGKKFQKPVRTFGGIQFMDDGAQGWASMMDTMKKFNDKLDTVKQMGGKPVGMTTSMGAQGGDFSLDTANLLIESLRVSDLTKTKLNEISKAIKNTVKTVKPKGKEPYQIQPFAKVPNINNMDEFAKYFRELPGSVRGELVKRFDKADVQNLGSPNVGQIRIAQTNPGLLAEDWLGMGARFVDLDPKQGVLPSKHTSYDSQVMKVPGAETYTFGTGIPNTIMLRKFNQGRRDTGKYGQFKPTPFDQRSLQMNTPVEVVDQQLIDEASKYLEIKRNIGDREAYEYAQKLIPAT